MVIHDFNNACVLRTRDLTGELAYVLANQSRWNGPGTCTADVFSYEMWKGEEIDI